MLYIRTWPIPKELQTPDALIIKIDKTHKYYPPESIMDDLTKKFDKLVNSLPKKDISDADHQRIWAAWDKFHEKARVTIRDNPNVPYYQSRCSKLDEWMEIAYTGRDVIIAVCEDRPFYSSWRRILCEYIAGCWDRWHGRHEYAIQIDDWPPNTVFGYKGHTMHVYYTYLEHPAADRIDAPATLIMPVTTEKPNKTATKRKPKAKETDKPEPKQDSTETPKKKPRPKAAKIDKSEPEPEQESTETPKKTRQRKSAKAQT